ncbi:M15 family metallopeptidase [Parachitinimonas caeni]|uniref:M15 family metallopeptidase n=1 Tax=Parachitinimonas caeni TaxID=3031301 RepID=A0ABT7DRR5_9NEIS|nr:M15 family metallopeptidase [Parachitinimonas caeni]MDK2122484.1 M15 family metallopeptidase [Parachitinimonas caeni]
MAKEFTAETDIISQSAVRHRPVVDEYAERIAQSLVSLGIHYDIITNRRLPIFREADELLVAEIEPTGRLHLLTPDAATAWIAMKAAAERDGVCLRLLSAFRSFERQYEIVCRRMALGEPLESLLALFAPPGFSEHHTGRAIDLGTTACRPLHASFDETPAFTWLCQRARDFDFSLTYPKHNLLGFGYQPWHWGYRG